MHLQTKFLLPKERFAQFVTLFNSKIINPVKKQIKKQIDPTPNITKKMPNFSTSTLADIVSLMIKNGPLIYKRNEGYSTLSNNGSMRYTELWNKDGYACLHQRNQKNAATAAPLPLDTAKVNATAEAGVKSEANKRRSLRTLVLLHGYGLGHGFFFQNFEHLLHGVHPSNAAQVAAPVYDRIVALDWPGFGHSERDVNFPNRAFYHDLFYSREKSDKYTMSSVDFFVDSLHEWRVNDENSLKESSLAGADESSPHSDPLKFEYVIAGHSLGGYLVGNYALKHPEALKGLILMSPIGLQAHPEIELTFSGNFIKLWSSFGFLGAFGLVFIRLLFTFNWTPQALARTLIFFRMQNYVYSHVRNYVSRRFPNNTWTQQEVDVIAAYLYDIWTTGVTKGELSLNSLLVPKLSVNKNFDVELANFNTANPMTPSDDSSSTPSSENENKNPPSSTASAQVATASKDTDYSNNNNNNNNDNNNTNNSNANKSEDVKDKDKDKDKKVFNNGKVQSREQARRSMPPRPINIGIHTRVPLHDKMHEMPVPTLLMYGDNDWLSYKGVDEDIKKWQKMAKTPFDYELIKDAGHYLYIDNSDMFNSSVVDWTKKNIGDLK